MQPPIWNRLTVIIALLLLCSGLAGCDGINGSASAPESDRELTPGTRFQDRLKDGGQGPEMIVVPSGRFMMGEAPDHYALRESLPVHEVAIDESFTLSTHEITNAQYLRFLNAMGRLGPHAKDYDWVFSKTWGRHSKIVEKEVQGWLGLTRHPVYEVAEGPHNEQRPITHVNWHGAQAYADWLSDQTGHNYRLPTEAEWEYATKAGTNTWYWWGNKPGRGEGLAVCNGCGTRWDDRHWDERTTAPVGSLEPNPFGLYDVHGNAWEWVQDCWHPNYEGAPTDGSAWLNDNDGDCRRVLRGGGITAGTAAMLSVYRKYKKHPASNVGGIRLARDL
ncbi:formylglycine-generating enzyme family protein [Halomonadaceae bacterium KBTZ08]